MSVFERPADAPKREAEFWQWFDESVADLKPPTDAAMRKLEELNSKDAKWSGDLVPLIGAYHDTSEENKAKIVEMGWLCAFQAIDRPYDGAFAFKFAPAVVCLMTTRVRKEVNLNEWKYSAFAMYPASQREVVNATSHRVEFLFDTHIKLHESRYELYFMMAHRPGDNTLQMHVAVADARAPDKMGKFAFLSKYGVHLDKKKNNILWYQNDRWWHHQRIELDKRDLTVWLNLCVVGDVSVRGASWTEVPSKANHKQQ